jgi:hypothetical protein
MQGMRRGQGDVLARISKHAPIFPCPESQMPGSSCDLSMEADGLDVKRQRQSDYRV